MASGALPADELLGSWAVWWAGDAMGAVVVTPFVLSLSCHGGRPAATLEHLEAGVLFA